MEGPAGADEAESKQSLEKLVFQHGGEYVQTFPKKEPSRIVAQTGDCTSIAHPQQLVLTIRSARLLGEEGREEGLGHCSPFLGRGLGRQG